MVREMDGSLALGRTVSSAATASQLGEYFQYVIDHPVSLGRQKSALLPIVTQNVEAARVSIYNQSVQPKHPLLGLKFKNTTGSNLAQGPITVFEGSVYAGDTRILDLQANEERLISFAIDLGMEVSAKPTGGQTRITKVRAVKGIIETHLIQKDEISYEIINRASSDRTLLIEQPNREAQQFVVVGDNKPAEKATDVYRFQVKVPVGKTVKYVVTEEKPLAQSITLTNSPDDQIRYFINLNEASPELKAKLRDALSIKQAWDESRRQIQEVLTRIQTIERDQQRLRENIKNTPKEAEVYNVYLKKLSEQEKEMTTLSDSLKTLQAGEATAKAKYEGYLLSINID